MTGKKEGTSLVTGGAGFIGNHLCRRLLEEGERVVCIDDLSTGSIDNVKELLENPRFSFVEADIRETDLQAFKVDSCYHLAAICGVPRVESEPLRVILSIMEGALRILRWAADRGVRILYVSSSEIYGSPTVHPQPETYWGYANPVGPRSAYVEAKRAGETLCRAYQIDQGLSVRMARLFNVYGPGFRNDDPRVVPQFIQAAESGSSLNIYGTGEARRSFCYVDDIVEGLMLLMESEVQEPVNLGFPEETGIKELAELLLHLSDGSSLITYHPAICEDPSRRCPDISRAGKLLGWQPRITLEQGLRITMDWFRSKKTVFKGVTSGT